MKIVKKDGTRERAVLIGMVVHDQVLARIADKWDKKDGFFKTPWANLIAGWCVDFHNNYGKAPRANIEPVYQSWADDHKADPDTVKLVEKFLGDLSGEYKRLKKEINPDYTVDLAAKHFNDVRLRRLKDAIDGDLELGKQDEAFKRIARFDKVDVGSDAHVDVLQDVTANKIAISEHREPLVKYPGALGEFFGDELERDAFVAFMAPMKRGKTFWLMDLAWRGMLQRRRVAFFEVGDLSQAQALRRFNIRAAGRPLKPTKPDKPVAVPKLLTIDGSEASVEMDYRHYQGYLTDEDARKARERVMLEKVKSKDSFLRLSTHPTKSVTVGGVRAVIDRWVRVEGWVPDVVCIDYADILAPAPGYSESRDAVNASWAALRRMSQELHCLVVTATQTKASSFTADMLDMEHFAEDNRKFAHVTAMYGINQSKTDKQNQVQRLNAVVVRESEFHVKNQVFVAGCLGLANPAVKSSF